MSPDPSWRAVATTALAPALFGTTYLVATSDLLPQGRPLLLASLRVVPAALLLLLVARPSPSWPVVGTNLAIGALAMGPYLAAFFVAVDRLPNGIAATISNVTPLFVMALGVAVLHERPTPRRVLAGAAAVIGVALLVGADPNGLDALGVVFGLLSAVCLALGLLSTGRLVPAGVRPIDTAAMQLLGAGATLVVLVLLCERRAVAVDGDLVLGTAILSAVLTTLPFAVLYAGVARIGPARTSLLSPITPVVATVLGLLFRDERLSAPQAVGLVVVLGAVLTAQLPESKRSRAGTSGRSAVP